MPFHIVEDPNATIARPGGKRSREQDDRIRRWLEELRRAKKRKPRTIGRSFEALRNLQTQVAIESQIRSDDATCLLGPVASGEVRPKARTTTAEERIAEGRSARELLRKLVSSARRRRNEMFVLEAKRLSVELTEALETGSVEHIRILMQESSVLLGLKEIRPVDSIKDEKPGIVRATRKEIRTFIVACADYVEPNSASEEFRFYPLDPEMLQIQLDAARRQLTQRQNELREGRDELRRQGERADLENDAEAYRALVRNVLNGSKLTAMEADILRLRKEVAAIEADIKRLLAQSGEDRAAAHRLNPRVESDATALHGQRLRLQPPKNRN